MANYKIINLFGRRNVVYNCVNEIPKIISKSYIFKNFDIDNLIISNLNKKNFTSCDFINYQNKSYFINQCTFLDLEDFKNFTENIKKDNTTDVCNVLVHDEIIDNFIFGLFVKEHDFQLQYSINDDYQIKTQKIKKLLKIKS